MKVINYGPGWEPKTLTCTSCKSELEYVDRDVNIDVCRDYAYDPMITIYYVICPICGKKNEIKKES